MTAYLNDLADWIQAADLEPGFRPRSDSRARALRTVLLDRARVAPLSSLEPHLMKGVARAWITCHRARREYQTEERVDDLLALEAEEAGC